jgi:hypothetical protein
MATVKTFHDEFYISNMLEEGGCHSREGVRAW